MGIEFGCQSECGALKAVVMKRPQEAFGNQYLIDQVWREQGFRCRPEYNAAAREHNSIVSLFKKLGVAVHYQPEEAAATMSAVVTRDAAVISEKGFVPCLSAMPGRLAESTDAEDFLTQMGGRHLGTVDGGPDGRLHVESESSDDEFEHGDVERHPAPKGPVGPVGLEGQGDALSKPHIEGGDVLWLDRDILLVGTGGRTNEKGAEGLLALMKTSCKQVWTVALNPHPATLAGRVRPSLSSCLSVLEAGKKVALYRDRFPAEFVAKLERAGFALYDLVEEEFENYGGEVLVVNPFNCVIRQGNPKTKKLLEEIVPKMLVHQICLDNLDCCGAVGICRPYSRTQI